MRITHCQPSSFITTTKHNQTNIMSTATERKSFVFKSIEAAPLSKSVGEELFQVPELSDESFSPTILINQRGGDARIENVVGFGLSLAEIDSQNAESLEQLAETGEIKQVYAVNLDMFTKEGLEHAEENGIDPRPSASVRLDYASTDSNQIRVRAGIGLPVPTVSSADGRNRRSQFPDWEKLLEIGSDINESFLRRVAMAAFVNLAKTDKALVGRMVEAMKPEEQAPKPTESTQKGPSTLEGLKKTEL